MTRQYARIKSGRTGRFSSWDTTGRNDDAWNINPGETRVLADIKGPGAITHIWMTQRNHYRSVLLKITWDDMDYPSVLCPLGDFFCLGHEIVNSFQSQLFTSSTRWNNSFNQGCALNCYCYMPFKKRALVELINESDEIHRQYFYIDHEIYEDDTSLRDLGFFHAEFHRENPFGGWGNEIRVNSNEADIANKERVAWENNYVILETKGKGQYIGCNISITNFQGTWWGEGDDMIWVDGYKWPPDLHGTGSEDYLNQAWGMQPNAFLRNGSSIFEEDTGGYQTSYVFHLENPVRFTEEIKVTIEHGHGNHLRNEVSSVAYWYGSNPSRVRSPPPVAQRMPVSKDGMEWVHDPTKQVTSKEIQVNEEMKKMKRRWKGKDFPEHVSIVGPITKDDEGFLCINMPFSKEPRSPIHEIPIVELMEFFIYKHVTLHVKVGAIDEIRVGTFEMSPSGNLLFKPEGENDLLEMKKLLEPTVGSNLEIEALIDIDKKQPTGGKPTSFVVYIQHITET